LVQWEAWLVIILSMQLIIGVRHNWQMYVFWNDLKTKFTCSW
jgi:hypothetical protein